MSIAYDFCIHNEPDRWYKVRTVMLNYDILSGIEEDSYDIIWQEVKKHLGDDYWDMWSEDLAATVSEDFSIINIYLETKPQDVMYSFRKMPEKVKYPDHCKTCNAKGVFIKMALCCPLCGKIIGGI